MVSPVDGSSISAVSGLGVPQAAREGRARARRTSCT